MEAPPPDRHVQDLPHVSTTCHVEENPWRLEVTSSRRRSVDSVDCLPLQPLHQSIRTAEDETAATAETSPAIGHRLPSILAYHSGGGSPTMRTKSVLLGASSNTTTTQQNRDTTAAALSRPLNGGAGRGQCSASSDLDLPTYEQLTVLRSLQQQQQGLHHRPDSVITTSSNLSSDGGEEAAAAGRPAALPPIAALPNVYTISGLYGAALGGAAATDVSHSPSSLSSLSSSAENPKTHKRSTSSTAASIMRSCQAMTHKRSHSHTVGYHHQGGSAHHHKRVSSAGGFVAGHRRTASGALIEVLDKMTGGALEMQQTTTDFLKDIQRQNQERKQSRQEQEAQLMDDDFSDLRDCGYFACKPACAQPLASIKVFVFLLSLLVILQQSLSSGYLNSVITTIEKRYEIPSSVSGIIASMYEIGNVFTVIFVSYLGSRRHIPAFIGVGAIVMGLSCILFSLPHFLSEPYSASFAFGTNITDENICQQTYPSKQKSVLDQLHLGSLEPLLDPEKGLSAPPLAPHNQQFNREDNCIKETSWSAAFPIFIFMLAQLLLGCSGSPIFTLGTTYIDDHVKRDTASLYLGVIYSMVAFGPVLGFLLGAYLLSLYVDTFTEDVSKLMIDSKSRHWVGMWWGGFLVCGVLILLISVPFFAFPKELKREKRKVYLDEKFKNPAAGAGGGENGVKGGASGGAATSPADGPPAAENTYGQSLKDLPLCIWKLITNFIYMVTCMGSCAELVIVSGFIVFLPKYLETQFSLSKSEANLLTGGTAIPGACIGILFGGYILKRLQLSPRGAIQLVLGCNFLCLSCYAMLFFFGCDNIKMAGVTSPFSQDSDEKFQVNLTASCNFGCSCDINDVQPVCGNNGLTYFSPCHAGCTSLVSSDNYTNCECVKDNFDDEDMTEMGSSTSPHNDYVTIVPVATAGPCYTHCQMLLPFMVLLFFMTLMVAITQMPLLMVVLRSVAEEEKAFALGIQFVIFRLFGYIPSPIMFGSVIDSTCLLWKQTCQGSQGGRCLVYDIVSFRYKYVGICAGIKSIAFLIFLLDWWLIRRKQKLDDELGLNVGDVVDSIVSMEKIFEGEGGGVSVNAVPVGDLEEGEAAAGGIDLVSPSKQPMIIPSSSREPE